MKVIMICTGNICRSPMAEGILYQLCQKSQYNHIKVDSAGIEGFHQGERADPRAIKIMQKYGYAISHLRARQINTADVIPTENIIMVATNRHLNAAERLKLQCHGKANIVKMLATHPEHRNQDLSDPYYGDENDFEITFQQLYIALNEWLKQL